MWKVPNKEVDLGEPTSFLDHVYLGCIDSEGRVISLLLPQIFAIRTWFCNCPQHLCLFRIFFECVSSWSYDMAGHAKKCVDRYCELANKTTQQLYKVSTPCIDDHHFKEEETRSVGELSNTCSQIVLKC